MTFSKLGLSFLIGAALGFSPPAHAAIAPQAAPQVAPETVEANLVLVFSDCIDLRASAVVVRNSIGTNIETGDLRFGTNGMDVEIPLSARLAPGNYTIEWTAVSLDGHKSVGGYAFTIDPFKKDLPLAARQSD